MELRTFGSFDLTGALGSIEGSAAQPKRLALIAYVAVEGHAGFVRRDALLSVFWPEASMAKARHALNQALYDLRQGLGADPFVSKGKELLRLDSTRVRCDAIEFTSRLRQGDLAGAVELYHGPFLNAFHLSGSPDFDRWLDSTQQRFHEAVTRACVELSETSAGQGDRRSAAAWARRVVALSPRDEPTLRRLIQILDRVGDPATAVELYEEFRTRLGREFDMQPSRATVELASSIRSRRSARPKQAAIEDVSEPPGMPPRGKSEPLRARRDAGSSVRKWPRARVLTGISLAVVLAAAVGLGIDRSRSVEVTSELPSVVVGPFEGGTDPAFDALPDMMIEWISQGLRNSGRFRVSRPREVPPPDSITADPRARAGFRDAESRESAYAVRGDIHAVEEGYRLAIRIENAQTGALIGALDPVTLDPDDLGAAMEEVGSWVLGVLALREDPDVGERLPEMRRFPTYDAYEEFIAGMLELERFPLRAFRAREHLLRAHERDTSFLYPLLEAARLSWRYREFDRADSILAVLWPRRQRLSWVERRDLESVEALMRGDHQGAFATRRRLVDSIPDYENLRQYSVVALLAGRYDESLGALNELDRSGVSAPGMWGDKGLSLHFLGRYADELDVGVSAFGADDPDAYSTIIRALAALGRLEDLTSRISSFRVVPISRRGAFGELLRTAGYELWVHGYREEAMDFYGRALDWREEERPRGRGIWLGETLYLTGQWEEARLEFEWVLSQAPDHIVSLGHLGSIAARLGDVGTAEDVSRRLQGIRGIRPFGANTLWRARIASLLGHKERAMGLLKQAVSEGLSPMRLHREEFDFQGLKIHPDFRSLFPPSAS